MATGHQLAQLIDSIKAANEWSDTDLVRNARSKGHVLSKSNISRYRNPVVSIKGDIIRALAAGLRITPAQVAIAALESMGVPLPNYDVPTVEQAVRLDTELSERDRESVIALLTALRSSSPTAGGPPVPPPFPAGGDVVEFPARGEVGPPADDGDAQRRSDEKRVARDVPPNHRKGQAEQGDAPDGGA